MVKNLVFKGGGVRGVAYAGALHVLEETGMMDHVEKTAGTSAGALMALLVALKYSAADIKTMITELDFKSLESGFNIFRLIKSFGLYSNANLLSWVRSVIGERLPSKVLFREMKYAGYPDFHCIATEINTQTQKIFSAASTPDIEVALAAVASMSIPFVFPRIQFPGYDQSYVDGGTVWNYPISIFDQNGNESETLGFYVHNYTKPKPLQVKGLISFAKATAQSALSAQDIDVLGNPEILSRTVIVDTLGISATDFGINDNQKLWLYNSGISCTRKFLKI